MRKIHYKIQHVQPITYTSSDGLFAAVNVSKSMLSSSRIGSWSLLDVRDLSAAERPSVCESLYVSFVLCTATPKVLKLLDTLIDMKLQLEVSGRQRKTYFVSDLPCPLRSVRLLSDASSEFEKTAMGIHKPHALRVATEENVARTFA